MVRRRSAKHRQTSAASPARARPGRRFSTPVSVVFVTLMIGAALLVIQHLPGALLADWQDRSFREGLETGLLILLAVASVGLPIVLGRLITRRARRQPDLATPELGRPAANVMAEPRPARPPMFYAWLSVGTAMATMALKSVAYLLTGSVALFSDAAESLVNLAGAATALLVLHYAARPADSSHPFGHGKAEYFSSGFEGALILVAAAGIGWTAAERVLLPQPVSGLDVGAAVAGLAAFLNLMMARALLSAARASGSIVLEADGRHLMTDVWTTVAVLSGLGGMWATGWAWLDPAIAIVAALHILGTGFRLIRRSLSGLLGAAIPQEERAVIERILDGHRRKGLQFHDLRTRMSGVDRFLTVHVLVPGDMSVKSGHDLLERLEDQLRDAIPSLHIVTHLEPIEDPASFHHEMIS